MKIERLEKQLEMLLEETGYQLQIMPGVSIAAVILISEIGNINRFKSDNQLTKFCGIAPVSIGSTGKGKEERLEGGNQLLRSTFYFIAVASICIDKKDTARYLMFRDYFLRRLMEGKTKWQALTSIMRQLVHIVLGMMKDKTEWKQPEYQRYIPSGSLKATVLKKKH